MIPLLSETIAAIATATGPAGVGIVRISGPNAFAVADHLLRSHDRPRTAHQPGQTLRRATVHDPATGEEIDDGLIAVFHAPHSLTGEHVVEIQGHGGALVLHRVLAAALAAGALGEAATPRGAAGGAPALRAVPHFQQAA